MSPAVDEHRSDWLVTVMAGCLVFTALTGFAILNQLGVLVRPIDLRIRIVHLVLVVILTYLVWTRRRTVSHDFCTAAFAAMVVPLFVTFWFTESWLAASTREVWQPFVGHKLLVFCIAALCPQTRWLAPLLLLGLGIEQVALWIHLGLGHRSDIPQDEPWVSIAFMWIALVLYGYRLYVVRHERELAHARSESAMLRTVNQAFLAVQDTANTPLQNLEIALALMKDQKQPSAHLLESASRAVARLRELGRLVPVKEVTSASIDPEVLAQIRAKTEDGFGADKS